MAWTRLQRSLPIVFSTRLPLLCRNGPGVFMPLSPDFFEFRCFATVGDDTHEVKQTDYAPVGLLNA